MSWHSAVRPGEGPEAAVSGGSAHAAANRDRPPSWSPPTTRTRDRREPSAHPVVTLRTYRFHADRPAKRARHGPARETARARWIVGAIPRRRPDHDVGSADVRCGAQRLDRRLRVQPVVGQRPRRRSGHMDQHRHGSAQRDVRVVRQHVLDVPRGSLHAYVHEGGDIRVHVHDPRFQRKGRRPRRARDAEADTKADSTADTEAHPEVDS